MIRYTPHTTRLNQLRTYGFGSTPIDPIFANERVHMKV